MPVIDPDGMFYGDRLAKLSLMARLYWPYFFAAANHCARLELNYHRIVNRAFSRFPQILTEKEFESYVREYSDNFLLFVYEANNELWGQFDTSERFLPRHKNAESIKSPNPGQEFIEWKSEYARLKSSSIRGKSLVSNIRGETARNGAENCEKLRGVGGGGGGGVGGEVKPLARISEIEPQQNGQKPSELVLTSAESPDQISTRKKQFLDESHERFYSGYWLKVGRKKSREAWPKAILLVRKTLKLSTVDAVEFLISKMEEQKAMISTRADLGWLERMYSSSWLNGARWEDQFPPVQASHSNGRNNDPELPRLT